MVPPDNGTGRGWGEAMAEFARDNPELVKPFVGAAILMTPFDDPTLATANLIQRSVERFDHTDFEEGDEIEASIGAIRRVINKVAARTPFARDELLERYYKHVPHLIEQHEYDFEHVEDIEHFPDDFETWAFENATEISDLVGDHWDRHKETALSRYPDLSERAAVFNHTERVITAELTTADPHQAGQIAEFNNQFIDWLGSLLVRHNPQVDLADISPPSDGEGSDDSLGPWLPGPQSSLSEFTHSDSDGDD